MISIQSITPLSSSDSPQDPQRNKRCQMLLAYTAALLFSLYLLPISPQAQANSWISVGGAPSSSGGGIGLSLASETSDGFGWGIGIIINGEIAGNDVLDYPVPHNNYTNLGTQRTGNSIGLDALWFPVKGAAWRPYVGLGLYYGKRAEVAQSNVTGWYYTQQDKSAVQIGGELGVQYKTSNDRLWGIGYHTVRGAFLSFGW